MRWTVRIATMINDDYSSTEEDFSSYNSAMNYLKVKADAWKHVAETTETLEWYRISIENN